MAKTDKSKTREEVLDLLAQVDRKFLLETPYEPLYMAGVKRTLSWFLNEWENPIEVSNNKEFFCSKCGTDLLVIIDKSGMKLCINCKSMDFCKQDEIEDTHSYK